ncbi:MAG TPA: ATP-binding protein [Symbiobacteriaceae bacterium]|nr:ATP-binding protein [Symbiobacteriaceae bacterium]
MESVLGLVRHSGNDGLFRAIEMSLLAAAAGHPLHLHAEGLRGTGKTSIMRAVRRVLPRIRRIKGCLYNCDPAYPHCPQHRSLDATQLAAVGDEWVPMPFLEISHSAKVGTVVGSIDLARLVSPSQPEAALLPGTIPQAHRGIIFVDEINRLAETAPELADVLLDVMGTKPGRVQIEETGLPAVELPVQVTVWAASNPDEDPGPLEDIRRQLSDRFDFAVYTDRPGEAAVVEEILALNGNHHWHRPLSPADETRAELFRSQVAGRVTALRQVEVPQHLRQHVAELYSRFNVESLRAVQAMQLGMRLVACLAERSEAMTEDLARIVPLALRHRVDGETIKKVTAHLAGLNTGTEPAPTPVARPRLPSISFGGAAVQSAVPVAQEAQPQEPSAAQAPAARREYATQYPPRPAGGTTPQGGNGWFNKAVAGLRKNLGLSQPQPQMRPEPRTSGQAGQGAQSQRAVTPPRPGQLFQRADQSSAAPPAGRPQGSRAGGARQGGSGGAGAGAGGGQAQVEMADPLATPPVAPPNRARLLSDLAEHELIRTEEELGRR